MDFPHVFSKLQSQLTCGVCLERYKDPRTLLCHHSYCKDCISQLPVSGQRQRVVKCPLCQHPTQLGENGSSALPISVHISDLLEIDTLLMKTPASDLADTPAKQQSEALNLQPVQKQIELVEETLVLFDTKEREMREDGKELQKKIDETHQQLTSKLEESKKKLSQEATDALKKKLQKHSSQKANVEAVLAKLKSRCEEKPGPPTKDQPAQAHMKQLCIADIPSSEQVKVSELQPTQELNVMFVADKSALLACAHIGDIITKPSFLSARFSVDIPSRIFAKRQTTVLIKAPITLPVSSKLSCQLAHQDGNPVVCPVTSVGEGHFKVMIRSSTAGLHQLRVLVDGLHIYGSPFSVRVTKWGRQGLMKFATLDSPYGIAVTDDGQHVVVTESEANCVTILDSGTGKVLRNFAGCDNQLKNPKSVAVSAGNHIFMATSDSKVEKFSFSSSCEGSYDQSSVKSVPKPGLTVSQPVSVAVSPVSGKVFCTNLDKAECCITVLNADLTLSHSISGKGLSSEMGSIAIDSKGMLYMYDYTRGVILKLTPEGKCLATIGSTGKQDYQFSEPVSICIDSDDIMYVADKEKCLLMVFNTEGEHLGTLQRQAAIDSQSIVKATSQRQFAQQLFCHTTRQHRHGVAADKNGNVYVCDYGNGEVLVSRP